MSAVRETLALHSVAPDLMPADAPMEAWNTSNNVAFRNGEAVSIGADASFFASHTGKAMAYVEPNDTPFWVIAERGIITAFDGTTEYDITPAGWTPLNPDGVWTSCVISGLAVINCSGLDPVWWDGNPANACTVLPDWPSGGRCLAIRAHKNFLFAVGFVSESGARVRWSDAAEAGVIPQEWAPSATNLAGFVDLAPLRSGCLDAVSMRDDLLIYNERSIHAATFTGTNDVFAFRKVFAETGIAATNAITSGPNDEHLFVGSSGDVFVTDGVDVKSVLDGRAQRAFYEDFQGPTIATYSAATLQREKMGIIAYPKTGDSTGTRALLFDFATGDIGFRDMEGCYCLASGRALASVTTQNEWDADSQSWYLDRSAWNFALGAATVDDVLVARVDGVFTLGAGELALPATLEKSGLAFGNPQARKMVSRVWPKVIGTPGDVIRFRIGGQETANGTTALGPVMEYEIGAEQALHCLVQGRFLTLLVDSDDTAEPWRLGTIDVEYREVGKW